MSKSRLVIVLAASMAMAINTFADVQNIRLSGDIRLRGYWLNNTADLNGSTVPNEDSFISQRTRITVEADLEDHVLVVATLKAEGLWGAGDETGNSSGAGLPAGNTINRGFDLGVSEAYVQLNEAFFSPATFKIGRQYLHYGHGLILSSEEQEYSHDAVRMVWDAYPFTLDLVYSKAVESTAFGPGAGTRDADLLFVNGRFEMTDQLLKNIEVYFGYMANSTIAPSRVPPAGFLGADSPMIIGVRSDMNISKSLQAWVEGAYEFGSATIGSDISAWLANAGFKFSMNDATWSPALNGNYTYASGGGFTSGHNFVPWYDYTEGYNGYIFAPLLSNIHIINLGASVKPYENTTLALQGYYYVMADGSGFAGSNGNIDYGPVLVAGPGSKDLGWEIDAILGYDYSKDVRCQLVGAVFLPSNAFRNIGGSSSAQEIRAEVNVRF